MKILIADDDAQIRMIIRRALADSGQYQFRTSTSVADTRATCESFQPDVLIIDDLGGGGVALGDELHARPGKPAVINTSTVRTSEADRVSKGSTNFLATLVAKVKELTRPPASTTPP